MDFRGARASTNYVDDTQQTGLQGLKTKLGAFLLQHGVINDAVGKPYSAPWQPPTPSRPGDWPTVGTPGGDIQWGPGEKPQGVMSAAPTHQSNDALARSHGFRDAATMAAYYQKQQAMRTGPAPAPQGGGMLQQLFAIHPAMLLGHVLDKWNQADGTAQ
jgi:hypothetical protein